MTSNKSISLAPAGSEFTLSEVEGSGGKINQKTKIMQNKPNLCPFCPVSDDYEEKQTQTNPIQTQNKAIFDPSAAPQTQTNPIKPNPLRATPPKNACRITKFCKAKK